MEGIIQKLKQLKLFKSIKEKIKPAIALPKAEYSMPNIIEEIRETERLMKNVQTRFDYCMDDDLIEATIMEMKSLERRYAYLIKEAKKEGVVSA